jgi:hypothetical protein
MTSISAGLALQGKIVYTYSIGNFPTLRCIEQIRNDCAYHDANVKVVCVGGGFVYGSLGMSHHATEDIAVMRALPNVTVLCPGDLVEAEAVTKAIANYPGTCYVRLGRGGEKKIHDSLSDFKIGKAISVKNGEKVAILSDIQGLEDFLGDMDFKVAGTTQGITAIQMDIKIKGIDENILRTALEQARVGRLHILDQMTAVLPEPRKELSQYAPKIISFTIDPEKIREVIGSGGKVINKIIEETGVKIDITDDGMVFIATSDAEMAEKAKKIIMTIAKDPEVGEKFTSKVVRVIDNLGAFVELAPGKDGMIHISQLAKTRVEKVTDVVNVGDTVAVKVKRIDDKGRIDLVLLKKL